MRRIQLSVTNFIHVGDEYLFLIRSDASKVDAGKLNGIGGKLEDGEDYLSAAIRETQEETGYVVGSGDMHFSGIVQTQEGYEDDWVMCFFRIEVASKLVPKGMEIPEGKLIWLPKDSVLTSRYKMVDDLQYLWEKITAGKEIFFMNAKVNSEEKIEKFSFSSLR